MGDLLIAPFINRLNVEPPITSDFEARELLFLQEPIESGPMNLQVLAEGCHSPIRNGC
jgi:hypothetical protein